MLRTDSDIVSKILESLRLMTTTFENGYAEVYDFLYQDKDYLSETQFLIELHSRLSDRQLLTRVLDLGCGTGGHLSYFPERVFKCGIDKSNQMITRVKARGIPETVAVQADVGYVHLAARFDLVYSLFHVLSYQLTDSAVKRILQSISIHLEDSGVAILDFWHRPAWEFDPPRNRLRIRQNDERSVVRVSEPSVDYVHSTVSIDITTFISDRATGSYTSTNETHCMRAFTLSELESLCVSQGLQVVQSGPWMRHGSSLTANEWYGWIALRRIPSLNR